MKGIKKVLKSLEDSSVLTQCITQTIEYKTRNKGLDLWFVIR